MVQARTIFGFLRHFVVILVLLARFSLISDGIIQTTRRVAATHVVDDCE